MKWHEIYLPNTRYPWRNIRIRMSEIASALQSIRMERKVSFLNLDPIDDTRIIIALLKNASKQRAGII